MLSDRLRDDALLRWFPVDNPDFGQWAYIYSRIIRRDKSGLTTIMDVSEVLRKRNDRSVGNEYESRIGHQELQASLREEGDILNPTQIAEFSDSYVDLITKMRIQRITPFDSNYLSKGVAHKD